MQAKISIVLPTRNRIPQLTRLLASIGQDPRVEVWLGIDKDDHASLSFARGKPGVNVVEFPGPPRQHRGMAHVGNITLQTYRSINLNHYYNVLALCNSTTSHVWAMNDDAEIISDGWIEQVLTVPQGWCGRCKTPGSPSRNWCDFPIVTREGVNALGFVLPEEHFKGWGADECLWRIYSEAGRTVDIDVTVKHDRDPKDFDRMFVISGQYNPKMDVSHWVKKLNNPQT